MYINFSVYLSGCQLHGIRFKHIEVLHPGGHYLLQLLKCVRLKGESCEALESVHVCVCVCRCIIMCVQIEV